MSAEVVDLFAGAGGWDIAARCLAWPFDPLGVELDRDACATRRAAGLRTLRGDVMAFDPHEVASHAVGLIASPPCPTFSVAGKGEGRRALGEVLALLPRVANGERVVADHLDPRTLLVLEPLRWALELEPEWIALEQVPPVLPIWQAMADVLRADGYHAVCGNLQAEQYGVPQTRKRAILLAARGPVDMPTPTHSRYYPRDPKRLDDGVLPWVSMAEALGWGMTARPSMTVCGDGTDTGGAEPFGNGARRGIEREYDAGRWRHSVLQSNQPIEGDALIQRRGNHPSSAIGPASHRARWLGDTNSSTRVTQAEAAVLQSFPADFPWQGTRTAQFRQIGNAIPPGLAHAALTAVVAANRLEVAA